MYKKPAKWTKKRTQKVFLTKYDGRVSQSLQMCLISRRITIVWQNYNNSNNSPENMLRPFCQRLVPVEINIHDYLWNLRQTKHLFIV